MGKISIFKNVKEANNPFNRDVYFVLKRIKDGSSKDLINSIRKEEDKKERNKLKAKLPCYTFGGTFTRRNIKSLVQTSGLLVLDFDDFDNLIDAERFKTYLKTLDWIFSAFISPSENVKALVSIPTDVEDYKLYFQSLSSFFKDKHPIDESGKDISRLCFESYDPEIYINDNPDQWIKKEKEIQKDVGIDYEDVSIPIKSEQIIISRLRKWIDNNFPILEGERNTNLFKFAISMSDFGIDKRTTESYLIQFSSENFKEKEILRTIKSAYDKGSPNFNTKKFEDKETKQKIKKGIKTGKTNPQLKRTYSGRVDDFDAVIDDLRSDVRDENFWEFTKRGNVKLIPHKFKNYLQQNNFIKYFPNGKITYIFVKKSGGIIDEVSTDQIKDFVLKDLETREDIDNRPFDFMADNPRYFKDDYLSFLDSAKIEFKKDTKNKCYLYYRNCALEITKNSIKEIDYLDLDGFVWKKQVIDRDFKKIDHHESEFRRFIWLISGQDVTHYESFRSIIGYLLHSYKSSAGNKAVILNDEKISDDPNGRSGKGLFWNALNHMKKVTSIDGKKLDLKDRFSYQTVSKDTQILVFDDVKRNFSFERLFSLITEGITLEYKNKDAVKIPVEDSPKILITTNYTVKGRGGSFNDRKIEMELSTYFNENHSPLDEFGHLLFDYWGHEEWKCFDSYMINCLQNYLENGIKEAEFKNIKIRKFISSTNKEFFEWAEDGNLPINERIYRSGKYNEFIDDYPDYGSAKYKLSQKSFKIYIDRWADFKGYDYEEKKDLNGRYTKIIDENKEDIKGEIPF